MIEEPEFTEPEAVPCLFVSGVACEFFGGHTRIVAWVDTPRAPGAQHERRIIGRWVMPDDVARALQRDLQKGLRRSGN